MNDLADRIRAASRMAHIAPFEVMEIQTLAREVEARGRDVVHLEIGEPDFRTPRPVVEAAKRALDEEPMFYTSALGLMALREAIARFYAERYRVAVPASRVIVTAGSSAALLLAFGVLLDPGEEVLLADPGYPCNRHFVRALGAVPKAIAVGPETRYQLTPELARRHWGEKTRMAMVASPSNPTGTLVTPQEIAGLAALARDERGTLLADEIYHCLTYGLDARTAAEAGEDVFVVNSFSKYFQMT
ncbi:MAG TPA: aminotransferase class I/II-fold pyridoxal phosphate-dependent enzyme, partial [Usitatibacter sp.]